VPILVAFLSWGGALGRARSAVSDLLFIPRAVPDSIAIIAIDEQSIQTIGQWPWPRAIFAQALQRLEDASVVGVDVNFKEASRLGLADDRALSHALRSSNVPVVLASEMQSDGALIRPISEFASVSFQGIANVTIDSDGIARTIRLRRGTALSLGAMVGKLAGGITEFSERAERINFIGPDASIPTRSFLDLIEGRIPQSFLQNRIILIGATAHDLQDFQNTPFGLMSGVEIQATIAENVLANNFLATSSYLDTLLTLVAGLCALGIGFAARRIWVIVLALAAMVVVVWAIVFVAFTQGMILDLLMPTIAIIASAGAAVLERYSTTARERRFIHDTFSRYLAPQVIAELLRDPSRVRLGGERRTLTILFSDIRGFTTLSETMSPQDLGHFLNRYLSAMTDLVLENRGVIDKYIGDAIMAFWGAPLDDETHALNGVRSALAMVKALEEFNEESVKLGKPTIAVGVGLNTGAVTVGNMGSEKRFDYTVIGDEVNLASRLEGLTKTYGVSIIVSDAVLQQIGADVCAREGIMAREIDRVRVKGKTQPVIIHQVMQPQVAERVRAHQELFTQGLAHYYAGRWNEALASLGEFIKHIDSDGPAELICERCREFVQSPPDQWAGVYEMTHK
jgi:adenylate cyclase